MISSDGGLLVPAGEQADDAVGVGIEGADEDVEIARVVGHAGFGPVTRGRAFAWLGLEELVDRRGLPPDGVVVAPSSTGGSAARVARTLVTSAGVACGSAAAEEI